MSELEQYAGYDGLFPINEDLTKRCIAALHRQMLHTKLVGEEKW